LFVLAIGVWFSCCSHLSPRLHLICLARFGICFLDQWWRWFSRCCPPSLFVKSWTLPMNLCTLYHKVYRRKQF
jgi:hypothetical protein